MIDTSKYEGHSTGWKLKMNNSSATIWNDEGHKVATTHYYDSPSNRHDRFIIEDSLKLLAEVKRLREDNELYLACIHASHFRDKPGSAMSKLNQMRFLQRGEEE
tara:strand:+ start:338 stop:649 length:312 start_codon:yes stop_codon:yes gene_type:complete